MPLIITKEYLSDILQKKRSPVASASPLLLDSLRVQSPSPLIGIARRILIGREALVTLGRRRFGQSDGVKFEDSAMNLDLQFKTI